VSSGLELSGVDSILVETSPLLKGLLGVGMVLFVVPVQHAGRVFDADTLAELLEDSRGVVQKVVGVDNTDVHSSALLFASLLSSKLGSDLTARTQVVEKTTLLVVAGFGGHEVVKTGNGVERGNGASPVAGNAVLGVADEESEVELVQDLGRDDGGVSRLGLGGVGVGRRALYCTIGI